MRSLIDAMTAEQRKLHRTFARALSLLAPATAVLFSLFALPSVDALAAAEHVPSWQAYAETLCRIWAVFLLPMMTTLQAVLLVQLEHANRQWKYLFTLPVPRGHFFVAKTVSLMTLVLMAQAVLFVLAGGTLLFAGLMHGGAEAIQAARWLLASLAVTACASLLLASLQLIIAIRVESFVAAISSGLAATLVAALGGSVMGPWAAVYPWTMPLFALQHRELPWLLATLAASAIVIAGGSHLMQRMEVQ